MLCKGNFRPAKKESIFLQNVGKCLPANIAYGPKKPESFYHNPYRYSILILSCHQHPDLPTSLSPPKLVYQHVVCVLTLPVSFILIILCEDNGLRIHSLSSLLQCHVTSFLFRNNILLKTMFSNIITTKCLLFSGMWRRVAYIPEDSHFHIHRHEHLKSLSRHMFFPKCKKWNFTAMRSNNINILSVIQVAKKVNINFNKWICSVGAIPMCFHLNILRASSVKTQLIYCQL
jgi:hypothetical protein